MEVHDLSIHSEGFKTLKWIFLVTVSSNTPAQVIFSLYSTCCTKDLHATAQMGRLALVV